MLGVAYDGSLQGDWVAHHAVQLAAAAPEPGGSPIQHVSCDAAACRRVG